MNTQPQDQDIYELITQPDETTFFERKSYVSLRTNEGKAEFIRDIIAMANVCRATGKEGKFVIGVAEKQPEGQSTKEITICGINKMGNDFKTRDGIQRIIEDVLDNYIEPKLSVVINFMEFKVEGKTEKPGTDQALDNTVLLITIFPVNSDKPYRVKKDFSPIKKGEAWFRNGESKHKITEEEVNSLHPFSKCPLILNNSWKKYFEHVTACYFNEMDLPGYQELETENNLLLSGEIARFLQDKHTSVLIIKGVAAIGKTTFLKRYIYSVASDLIPQVEKEDELQEFRNSIIPIYYSLVSIKNLADFERNLIGTVNHDSCLFNEWPLEFSRLFDKYPWLIILDGFDELNWNERKSVIRIVSEFLSSHPKAKIIIATRPINIQFPGHCPTMEASIKPFDERKIRLYLRTFCDDEQIAYIDNIIHSDKDLFKICSIPYYLEIARKIITDDPHVRELFQVSTINFENSLDESPSVTSQTQIRSVKDDSLILTDPVETRSEPWDNAPIQEEEFAEIPIGVILKNIYEEAWRREEKKKNIDKTTANEIWRKTEKLAMKNSLFSIIPHEVASKTLRKEGLLWCLHISVLADKDRNYHFYSKLTQGIFVASYLDKEIQDRKAPLDQIPIPQQIQDNDWILIFKLLRDINPAVYLQFEGGHT